LFLFSDVWIFLKSDCSSCICM